MSKFVLNDNQETWLKNSQAKKKKKRKAKKREFENFNQKIHCAYSTNSKSEGFVDLSKSTRTTDEKFLQIYNDVNNTGLE